MAHGHVVVGSFQILEYFKADAGVRPCLVDSECGIGREEWDAT